MNDHIGKAKLNPASEFKRPMDVVEASDIPASEKLAILRAWEADERALQRAETEGMGGGEHAHLHKVQEALAHLEEEAPLLGPPRASVAPMHTTLIQDKADQVA